MLSFIATIAIKFIIFRNVSKSKYRPEKKNSSGNIPVYIMQTVSGMPFNSDTD